MIHKHPARVIVTLVVVAAVFLGLGGPGRNDKSGAWMYISGVSFIAFLLTFVVLLIVSMSIALGRRRATRARTDRY